MTTFRTAAEYLGLPATGEHARLYRNEGGGRFREISHELGIDRGSFVMGANHGDLDNDGFPDIYLGTGAPDFRALMPNRMFRSAAARHFEDVTTAGGFGHLQKGHGISFADLDGDGDQDVHAVMGGAYEADVYPNAVFLNPGGDAAWITLRLEGTRANRDAIGARIRVVTTTPAGPRDIWVHVDAGGSFGGNSLQQEIGLGDAGAIERVEVRWPDGSPIEIFADVPMRRILRLRQGSGVAIAEPGMKQGPVLNN